MTNIPAIQGPFVVAIDGPAAAGKGTISRALAEQFGMAHLDTGLIYRAVGRKAQDMAAGGDVTEAIAVKAAQELTEADMARDGLRTAEAGQAASVVAVIQPVRDALLVFQRRFAARAGGAVLDGRDIGTVICPDAPLKLFVTASAEVRAERRHAELLAAGSKMSYKEVLADVRARDARDASRDAAPMVAAHDAHLIDTSELSIGEAVAKAAALTTQALG